MKHLLITILFAHIGLFAKREFVLLGPNKIVFSDSIPIEIHNKKVTIHKEKKGNIPIGAGTQYDSLKYTIVKYSSYLDSTANFEQYLGIHSDRWAVKEKQIYRPLNINDLKPIFGWRLNERILSQWILPGWRIYSENPFKMFVKALSDSNVIKYSLPDTFIVDGTKPLNNFKLIDITLFTDKSFFKLTYLVSVDNRIMLLSKEKLFSIVYPKLKSLPGIAAVTYEKSQKKYLRNRIIFEDLMEKYGEMFERSK